MFLNDNEWYKQPTNTNTHTHHYYIQYWDKEDDDDDDENENDGDSSIFATTMSCVFNIRRRHYDDKLVCLFVDAQWRIFFLFYFRSEMLNVIFDIRLIHIFSSTICNNSLLVKHLIAFFKKLNF